MAPRPSLPWEEVEHAAERMFRVWADGAEVQWAEEVWGHLERAGLTRADTVLEQTRATLRLLCLALMYRALCRFAWDEDTEVPATQLAEDLDIDPVALGILAAVADPSVGRACATGASLMDAALAEAALAEKDGVYECLCEAYGGSHHLHMRVWQTYRPDEPDSGGAPTRETLRAFQFIENGFQF